MVTFVAPNVPGIYLSIVGLGLVTLQPERKSLMIGTKLAAGTAADNEPVRILSQADADALFGQASMLSRMVWGYLQNSSVELWAVGVPEDAGGTAAAGDVVFAGAASQSGTLSILVAGQRVRFGVTKDDTAAQVAAKFEAAADDIPTLPVSTSTAVATTTLTCLWKGATGNDIDVRLEPDTNLVEGITITFPTMAGGATDPLITTALANLGDVQYDTIALGYNDATNIDELADELDIRWSALRQIDGQGYVTSRGDYATVLALGGTLNSQNLSLCAPSLTPTPSWEWSSMTAGIDATTIEIPSQIMGSRESKPVAGGWSASIADSFDFDQKNVLLATGVSVFKRDNFGSPQVHYLVTTYQLNDQGFPDTTFEEVGVVRGLSLMRREILALRGRYVNFSLTADALDPPPPNTLTPDIFRQGIVEAWVRWRDQYGLVQNFDGFNSALSVTVDPQNPSGLLLAIPVYMTRPFRTAIGELAAA